MLIQGSAVSKRSEVLAAKYAELLNSGVEACEILVLTLNSFKKNIFIEQMKSCLKINHFENQKIYTFYGLVYNTVKDNWAEIENTITSGKTAILPNLTGLEISQFFFKQAIKEVGFKDYNSKINLIHQLFRRNSLIVNNNLSDKEVAERSRILNETFAGDAKTAIDVFKKKTIEYRAFDYIRQVNIFNLIRKKTDYFKGIKYLIVDDADEITPVEFDFIKDLKPQLKEVYIGYDKYGSSRLGFLNTDVKTVEKLEEFFKSEKIEVVDKIEKFENNTESNSCIRRLEMIEAALAKTEELIKNGVKPDDISIITPVIDSALRFSVSEAFDEKGINYQYFSGSQKLVASLAVKNVITLLSLSLGEIPDIFRIRSVLSEMIKIPVKYTIVLVSAYKKNSILEFVDLENETYNNGLKALLEVVELISAAELSLSDKIFIIYKNLMKDCPDLETFNFFVKQIEDFELVFEEHKLKPKMQKEILIQLENSIISENPASAPERKENHILISTAQKVIDFSIKTKYQIWLDVSSNEWTKEDLGTLYNAWVFQKSWNEAEFTYEDNLNFSKLKTKKMLRKLSILAQEKILTYSSLFDIQGNENFGGIEEYLSEKKENLPVSFNFTPREDQKPVLGYKSGAMAVSAVPGAGKTTILLALVIKLLQSKISPENIFVMTYMDSAARNFKERIKTACPSLEKLPSISTIHGLALRILKENSNFVLAGLNDNFEICDDNQRQKIMREILAKLNLSQDDFDKYEKAVSALKLSDTKNVPYTSDSELKKFLKFFYSYNFHLKDRNIIDYDDMLFYCVKILEENKDTREYYQNLCRYVIEDEAQDSSVIQQKLLSLLSGKYGNLIRCGDVNQAITTTFTNSDTKGFRTFIQNSNPVEMNRSQRCAEGIYTLANSLVAYSKEHDEFKNAFHEIKMEAVEGKNPKSEKAVESIVFADYKEERDFILEKLRKQFAANKNSKAAILVRNNYSIEEYASFLSSYGFSVITKSDLLSEQPVFAIVFAVLKFLEHPWQNDKIAKIAEVLNEQKILKFTQEEITLIKESPSPFIMSLQDDASKSVSQLWWDVNYWLEASALPARDLAIKIGNYYYSSSLEKSNIYMISLLFKKLSNQYSDYSVFLERLEELANKPVMNQFKFYVDEETQSDSGKVQIMTYHKSKGDEFDCVFLPQFSEEFLPLTETGIKIGSKERFMEAVKALNHNYKKKDERALKLFQIEENLRLLYVAFTRAKTKLYITSGKKYKKFSRVKDFRPSILFDSILILKGSKNDEKE